MGTMLAAVRNTPTVPSTHLRTGFHQEEQKERPLQGLSAWPHKQQGRVWVLPKAPLFKQSFSLKNFAFILPCAYTWF